MYKKCALYVQQQNVHSQGVAIGSPLGPVLRNIFMVELETALITNLSNKLSSWRQFVDDRICFEKKDSIKFVLDTLNNFLKNIKFTFEEDIDGKIPFLDTLLVDTTVYRKKTNSNINLNWNSFGPNSWNWGTLRTIANRPFEICSTDNFLEEEIEHIRAVFYHQNNYPLWVIDKIINEVKEKAKVTKLENDENGDKKHRLVLPYKVDTGNHILRSMKNMLENYSQRSQHYKERTLE